jgi:hypothetical protein
MRVESAVRIGECPGQPPEEIGEVLARFAALPTQLLFTQLGQPSVVESVGTDFETGPVQLSKLVGGDDSLGARFFTEQGRRDEEQRGLPPSGEDRLRNLQHRHVAVVEGQEIRSSSAAVLPRSEKTVEIDRLKPSLLQQGQLSLEISLENEEIVWVAFRTSAAEAVVDEADGLHGYSVLRW